MSSPDFSSKTMAWKWKCGEVTEMTGFFSIPRDHVHEMGAIIDAAKSDHQEHFHKDDATCAGVAFQITEAGAGSWPDIPSEKRTRLDWTHLQTQSIDRACSQAQTASGSGDAGSTTTQG